MKFSRKAALTFLGALHSWIIFTVWKQQWSFSFFPPGGRSISPVAKDVFALVMKCSHIMFALSSARCSMNRSYGGCQNTFILEVSCKSHVITSSSVQ